MEREMAMDCRGKLSRGREGRRKGENQIDMHRQTKNNSMSPYYHPGNNRNKPQQTTTDATTPSRNLNRRKFSRLATEETAPDAEAIPQDARETRCGGRREVGRPRSWTFYEDAKASKRAAPSEPLLFT